MVKHLARIGRHLWASLSQPAVRADSELCRLVEAEIAAAEASHNGEIVLAIEGSLALGALWRGVTPRERAVQLFSGLRVWDTEANNGVLIYVLLGERAIEIVTDRAVTARISPQRWQRLCDETLPAFGERRLADGARQLIRGVAGELARHWPAEGQRGNELPNQPVLL